MQAISGPPSSHLTRSPLGTDHRLSVDGGAAGVVPGVQIKGGRLTADGFRLRQCGQSSTTGVTLVSAFIPTESDSFDYGISVTRVLETSLYNDARGEWIASPCNGLATCGLLAECVVLIK